MRHFQLMVQEGSGTHREPQAVLLLWLFTSFVSMCFNNDKTFTMMLLTVFKWCRIYFVYCVDFILLIDFYMQLNCIFRYILYKVSLGQDMGILGYLLVTLLYMSCSKPKRLNAKFLQLISQNFQELFMNQIYGFASGIYFIFCFRFYLEWSFGNCTFSPTLRGAWVYLCPFRMVVTVTNPCKTKCLLYISFKCRGSTTTTEFGKWRHKQKDK